MAVEEFQQTIDKLETVSKYNEAQEIYNELLYEFVCRLSHRQLGKLIPIMAETKRKYLKDLEEKIMLQKIENAIDEALANGEMFTGEV